jgi:predicted TIM-barrel fold metal-dependent hydrolase
MSVSKLSKSAAIRARLKHPVIDSDGHTLEANPVFFDYLKSVAGARVAEKYDTAMFDTFLDPRWSTFSNDERRDRRTLRPTWWAVPMRNTRDLATAMMPKLMYERLAEMGLDFSVVYPTLGLLTIALEDDELRQASARALNLMKAEMFGEYSDRLTPAATIPMHTPHEAINELEHAVTKLGLKVAMVASYVRRPIPKVAREFPGAGRYSCWLDTYGLDSEYDYDPFWKRCVELGITPTFHSVGYGWGSRTSISNYVHNHIGNFAASAEAICKGLFLGGVPVRFPTLRFAFLEGGAAWARTLFCELISHWKKRNRAAMENYNPANMDRAMLVGLARRYGGKSLAERAEQLSELYGSTGIDPALIDEWAPSGVRSAEDIRDIFSERFFFGCEGDDPLNMIAFNPMGSPFAAQLRAFYGSDIGHWDVPDMSDVLEEACELVEDGLMNHDQLRDFVFVNPVNMWTATNPDFFKGTVVEGEVTTLVAAQKAATNA